MIDLPDFLEKCICIGNHNPHISCQSKYCALEEGQAIKLEPKNNKENVKLIIIDGCVIDNSSSSKCDGLFLFENEKGEKFSFLFELKNRERWPKPVDQLNKTKSLKFYSDLINKLKIKKRNEKFVVVGSYIPTAIEKQNIEKAYGIRIISIIREKNEPYPNLRKYI